MRSTRAWVSMIVASCRSSFPVGCGNCSLSRDGSPTFRLLKVLTYESPRYAP